MQERKKTAGELAHEAAQDSTRYDYLELGYALSDDVLKEVWECIDAHQDFFDIPEFCVVMMLADDCLIHNAKRRKFYAWPFLPQPRPRQAVFHYNKATDDIQFLWSLPPAHSIATLSMLVNVDKRFARMKGWCDAFYAHKFFEHIREQAGIEMLSEKEHIALHGGKHVDSGSDNIDTFFPEAFDFDKPFKTKKIIDTTESIADQ